MEDTVLEKYPCGCVRREGSKGYCAKHWDEGYFAGNREEPRSILPERVEDDFCF